MARNNGSNCQFVNMSPAVKRNCGYSRLPITRTFKENRKKFVFSGVRVIGSSKKIGESKGNKKKRFYCLVNILITVNCGNVKGTVSRLCARASVVCFFFKRQQNCHIDSTRFPSGPHRRRLFVVYILKYFQTFEEVFRLI